MHMTKTAPRRSVAALLQPVVEIRAHATKGENPQIHTSVWIANQKVSTTCSSSTRLGDAFINSIFAIYPDAILQPGGRQSCTYCEN